MKHYVWVFWYWFFLSGTVFLGVPIWNLIMDMFWNMFWFKLSSKTVFRIVPVWIFIIGFVFHRVLIWNLIRELFSNMFRFKRCSQNNFLGCVGLDSLKVNVGRVTRTPLRTGLTFMIIWNTHWNCSSINFVFNSWIIFFRGTMQRMR